MKRSLSVSNFDEWRKVSRDLIEANIPPDEVSFAISNQKLLFAGDTESETASAAANIATFKVSKAFIDLAEFIAMHRDPSRWDILYRTLYRLVRLGERHLLELEVDPDIHQLTMMQKAVARDIHKMHAFVRFRKVNGEPEQYIAWHRPDHYIVKHVGPWFAKRFGAMHWAILTPDQSAYWDTAKLRFGPGLPQSDAPQGDELEELWRSYYSSVFNPARANVNAMKKELPVRHWATLPEAQVIPKLLAEAAGREREMRELKHSSAEQFLPTDGSLPKLAAAVRSCKGCDLHIAATQAVFGEGPPKAKIMLVGEQPGDQEDLKGHPFVGPAGQLLNKALQQAGVDRTSVYITNAVKHFKFEERGKRRIHKKPSGGEVAACRPWLTAEIAAVEPQIIVALGATAALSVGGREFAIQKERGKLFPLPGGRQLMVTVHPSFLLRVPDENRDAEFARFVEDLQILVDRAKPDAAAKTFIQGAG